MTTAAKVLDIARAELGQTEQPFGSNRTKYGAWYGLDANPWCAMFVSWVFARAGLPQPASTPKGFAYTPSGANWYRQQGRWHTANPQPGDVVFFDFPGDGVNRISHVGIVESVGSDGTVICLEGNTDERGGRTGGKVMRKARRTGIVGYGRPAWPKPAPTKPQEIQVTPRTVVYVHPREGLPDALAGLTQVVGRIAGVMLTCDLELLRQQDAAGRHCVVVGGPAVREVAGKLGGAWPKMVGRGTGVHRDRHRVIVLGAGWADTSARIAEAF